MDISRLFLTSCTSLFTALLITTACGGGSPSDQDEDPGTGGHSMGGSDGSGDGGSPSTGGDTSGSGGEESMGGAEGATCDPSDDDCDAGFECAGAGDGFACTDIDECAEGLDDCDEDSYCVNFSGSFSCAPCPAGFTLDGDDQCVDLDECSEGTHSCDENASCDNTAGSYECTCDGGFEGNGTSCDDIDECESGVHSCSERATCDNTDGFYECECKQGFEGDGKTCTDIDECAHTETAVCGVNAQCDNSEGSYSCECWPGFVGDADVLCCPLPPTVVESASIVLSVGHVDALALSYDCANPSLSVFTKDGTAGFGAPVYRDASSVLIHGGPDALFEVPADLPPEYDFLGSAGDNVWILPESQLETVVWPGWDTGGIAPGIFDADNLTLTLTSVEGPGRFVGYFADFVPQILFDPENGINTVTTFAATHVHLNWFFSEPGLYKLDFAVTAIFEGGMYQTTTYATLRFLLGDLAALPESEPPVLAVTELAAGYSAGDSLNISAERYGAPSLLETTWLRQCLMDWETLQMSDWMSVGTGADLSHVLLESDFQCHFRAVLLSGNVEVATSQPVAPSYAF